jgi:hypothetical protein
MVEGRAGLLSFTLLIKEVLHTVLQLALVEVERERVAAREEMEEIAHSQVMVWMFWLVEDKVVQHLEASVDLVVALPHLIRQPMLIVPVFILQQFPIQDKVVLMQPLLSVVLVGLVVELIRLRFDQEEYRWRRILFHNRPLCLHRLLVAVEDLQEMDLGKVQQVETDWFSFFTKSVLFERKGTIKLCYERY